MKPKDKAKELVDRMLNTEHCGIEHFPNENYCDCLEMNLYQSKQCALIAVDEIIKSNPCSEDSDRGGNFAWSGNHYYWEEVKREIEKL